MAKAKETGTKRILDRVLKDIKPTPAEIQQTTSKVNELMGLLGTIVPRNVELRVAGSIARGTNLRGSGDIDIFMLFNKGMPRDAIVKLGLQYAKKAATVKKGSYEVKYAEHPYVRLYLDSIGMRVDVVPALKIDNIDEMGTTVDRTPMHTEFINRSLSPRQRDEVRLLKCFMKAHGIYGAEIKINGFSGYLCELLVHHYGSLHGVLKAASAFKLPVVIKPLSRNESNDGEIAKKFNSSFVVIDPVDSDRNVAAGVSIESLGRLTIAARQFLYHPSASAFHDPKPCDGPAAVAIRKFASSAGLETFLFSCKVPDKSEDVVYPQLRKVGQQIVRHLQGNGFAVFNGMPFMYRNFGYIFLLAPGQRIKSRLLKGPDIFLANATLQFEKKHTKAYGFTVSGSSIYVLEGSRYLSVEETLRKLPKRMLKHKDIDLSSARLLVNRIPAHVAPQLYKEIMKKFTI